MSTPPPLKITNLTKTIGNVTLFKKLNISATQKQGLLINGESGKGKTTLIKILAGLIEPDGGTVEYGDVNLQKISENTRTNFRRKNIGIAFQSPHIIPSLTVEQNILLAMEISNLVTADRFDRLNEVMGEFEIAHRRKNYIETLSGGEQRRVALARALVNKPKILMLDEPLTGLDYAMALRIIRQIIKTCDEVGALMIVATHDDEFSSRIKNVLDLDTLNRRKPRQRKPIK